MGSSEIAPALQVLTNAIDSIPDPTFVVDMTGVLVGWNKAIEELSGVDREAVLGRSGYAYSEAFFGVPCPDLIDLLLQKEDLETRYNHIIKGPAEASGETFAAHARGGRGAWLWARAALVFEPGQEAPVGAVEVLRDISQQKSTETGLRMAEAISKDMADFFDNVVQGANVWIVYTDFQGCILLWNECAERISGFSAGEVIGRNFRQLVYPDSEYRQKIQDGIDAVIKGEGQIRDFRTTVTCRDGRQRILSWNITRLSNGTEEELGYLEVGMDITELQEAQDHISKLNKLLEAFYAISQQIVKAGDSGSLLLGACESLVQTRDYVLASCSLLDDQDQIVEIFLAGQYDLGVLSPDNILQGFYDLPVSSVIRTHKPYVCQDLYLKSEFEPWFAEARSFGICAFISVPMRSQGSVVGVLTLFASDPDSIDDHEIALLQELANDLAFASQSITMRDNLTALQEVSLGITDTQELGTTFERALTACMSLTRASSGFVYLKRPIPDTQETMAVELGGKVSQHDEKTRLNIELLIEGVLSTCEPVIKNRLQTSDRRPPKKSGDSNPFSSLMLIPMLHKGKSVGVIGLGNGPVGFSWSDLSLCYPFAAQLSLAAKNTELFSEVTLALEEAREKELRFRTIFDSAADLIIIVDAAGKIQECNNRLESLLGYEQEEVEGQEMEMIFHPDDHPGIRRLLAVTYRMGSRYNEEYRLVNSKQDPVDVEINSVVFKTKDGDNVLMLARDISERKKATEQLKYLSLHDAMTGLYNRRYFEEELRRLDINRHKPVSVISCDVDALKLVNDTLGHKKGDELIKAAAKIIKHPFRSSDVIARIGGDEFAVILPHSDETIAQKARNRILAALDRYNINNPQLPLSISVGVATSSVEPSMEKIFHESDNAMYKHKASRGLRSRGIITKILMIALGEKDFVSTGHVQRVRDLAVRFGEFLGLSSSDLDDLSMLAQVHDIGKIGVDESFFLKPGHLDKAERLELEKHSELGRRIAVTSPELERVAEGIFQHHEWWNGQGYPRGLREEEICVNARIFSIIDAYDAMTSPRPYREAVSKETALAELKDKAGVQFDPTLVSRFEKMMNSTTMAESGQ